MRTLAGTGAAVAATAVAGGLASSGAKDPWFRALRTPPFQPPPQTFGIVWPVLYAGIAVGGAQTLDALDAAGPAQDALAYRRALGANLAVNAAWTWLFFRLRQPALATLESAALTASTADLIRRGRRDAPRAQWLLAPYLAWGAFATVLSGSITWLNRKPLDRKRLNRKP